MTVAVDTDTAYLTDPVTGDAVIDVEYTNAPVKGQLKIYKQGEVLKGFDKDFQYEMTGLQVQNLKSMRQRISIPPIIR